jgi:hypothetical protein
LTLARSLHGSRCKFAHGNAELQTSARSSASDAQQLEQRAREAYRRQSARMGEGALSSVLLICRDPSRNDAESALWIDAVRKYADQNNLTVTVVSDDDPVTQKFVKKTKFDATMFEPAFCIVRDYAVTVRETARAQETVSSCTRCRPRLSTTASAALWWPSMPSLGGGRWASETA